MEKIKGYLAAGLRRLMPGHDPNFIIIGAQKAGTSSLHYYLSQHPKLQGSRPKEVHYFDKHFRINGKDLKWYRRHFRSSGLFGSEIFFESTPNYLCHEEVAKRLSAQYPDIKLVVLLREPVMRAFSAWNMYKSLHEKFNGQSGRRGSPVYMNLAQGMNFPSFAQLIQDEIEAISSGNGAADGIVARGLYFRQIKNYLSYFKREQMLFLGFRELRHDPKATCNKVLDFLGIDRYSWSKVNIRVQNKGHYADTLSNAERQVLENFYKVENQRLFEFLGSDLKW